MPRSNFSVATFGNMLEQLVEGSLSGSGTKFLRASCLVGGTHTSHGLEAKHNTVSQSNIGVRAYGRYNSLGSGAGVYVDLLARVTQQSPLTGYRLRATSFFGNYELYRTVNGVSTLLATVGGSPAANSIFELRLIVNGSQIQAESRIPPGGFATLMSVVDPTPIVGAGTIGFAISQNNSGSFTDIDDLVAFDVV